MLSVLMQVPEYYGWFSGPDGRIFDRLLTGRGKPDGFLQDSVAVLEIDQPAYEKCFHETSPLKPELIVSLVQESLAGDPRVVGVDIFTESPAYKTKSLTAPGAEVIWISGVESGSKIEVATLPEWLFGGLDHLVVKPGKVLGYDPAQLESPSEIRWGVPAFPRDDDSTIRRFPRNIEVSADPEHSEARDRLPSWARQIASQYCGRGEVSCTNEDADEVYVSYAGAPIDELNMLDYFSCSGGTDVKLYPGKRTQFKLRTGGKALLIGGTFRPSGQQADFHETPNGLLAGVVINAYAVRAEIEGRGLHEIRQPVAWLVDFLVGALLVLIFDDFVFEWFCRIVHMRWLKKHAWRFKIGASFILLAVFYILVRAWAGAGYILGFAGVSVGVLTHQIIDIWVHNPKHHK